MTIASMFAKVLWPTAGLSLAWRKLLYRQLCEGDKTPDFQFSTEFFGLKYEGNLNNNIEANIFFYGAFEKPLLFFLRDCWNALQNEDSANPKTAFIDIGSNVGQHSLFMSGLANEVVAFEPFSEVSNKLKYHISLNKLKNIKLEQIALSDREEMLDFYAPIGRNQGIGSFDTNAINKGNIATKKLQLIRGDSYFRKQPYFIRLIKIDVEGFEKKVITGLNETLSRHRPVIVCEVSYGNAISFTDEKDLLARLPEDYLLFRFDTRNTDGTKAKKRGSRAKRTGFYRIVPIDDWRATGQDDIIALPAEKNTLILGLSTK